MEEVLFRKLEGEPNWMPMGESSPPIARCFRSCTLPGFTPSGDEEPAGDSVELIKLVIESELARSVRLPNPLTTVLKNLFALAILSFRLPFALQNQERFGAL